MATQKVRVPSYCLHKASGQAVVRVNGRDVYLGNHGSPESHDCYDRVIAKWLADKSESITGNDDGPPWDLTVNEMLLQYLKFAECYYRKNGRTTKELSNMKYAATPLAELYGSLLVREIGPSKLKAVRLRMMDGDISRKVINERVNRVRRIFKWGVENELVPPHVLHGLQAVSPLKRGRCQARETVPVKPVPDAHVLKTIDAAPPTLAAMIQIQWRSGMRPGELVIMRPCDIDTSDEVWFYRPQEHKTEHFGIERLVPLGPRCQELLIPRMNRAPESYLFTPGEVMRERYAVRKTHRKKPNKKRKTTRKLRERYMTGSYAQAVRTACRMAGVPHWSPNQLRHAAATKLRSNFGLDAAQVILGHKTASITQIYAEANKAHAFEVVLKIG